MHPQGRHRYHRLASEEVAATLEALGGLTEAVAPVRRWPHGEAFRTARLCYDHLAGRLGVAVHAGLAGRGWITPVPAAGRPPRGARRGWRRSASTCRRPARPALRLRLHGLVRTPGPSGGRAGAGDRRLLPEPALAGGLPGEREGDPMARRRLRLTPEGARCLNEALGVAA